MSTSEMSTKWMFRCTDGSSRFVSTSARRLYCANMIECPNGCVRPIPRNELDSHLLGGHVKHLLATADHAVHAALDAFDRNDSYRERIESEARATEQKRMMEPREAEQKPEVDELLKTLNRLEQQNEQVQEATQSIGDRLQSLKRYRSRCADVDGDGNGNGNGNGNGDGEARESEKEKENSGGSGGKRIKM